MDQEYRRFLKAVAARDADAAAALIHDYPELHDYEGANGSLVEVLYRQAPGLLELALKAGLSPDAGPALPIQTFLQYAAAGGELDLLRLALRYGANPEKRNDWGEVALGYACSHGQLEAVKLLIEAGADVNAVEERPETGYRSTPLDGAGRYPEIAEYLRSRGARLYRELAP